MKFRSLLQLNRPLVMGVLNCTPDSFSDGGDYLSVDAAVSHAFDMIQQRADIIDIGGESTRPGSQPVSKEEELRRVIPVIEAIRNTSDVCISIDTTKAIVAKEALKAGADIVNDISALRFDTDMAAVIANAQVPVILMHMQGTPQTMQQAPQYHDVVNEVISFLKERILFSILNGIKQENIIVDPGIGFGKRLEDNLALLANLKLFSLLKTPVLVGVSRKSFIEKAAGTQVDAKHRLGGSLAGAIVAVQNGAKIVRVHDVAETVQAVQLLKSIQEMGHAAV